MNFCVQELYEVHPAAGSNCYMQATDYYTYFEDSPGYSGGNAQAVPSNNIYMEQAWAVNQPYTCSYPGNVLKSKDSDLDMALNQYSQPDYFTEEKPTFSQAQSPAYSQKKGRDCFTCIGSEFPWVSLRCFKVTICIRLIRPLILNAECLKLKRAGSQERLLSD